MLPPVLRHAVIDLAGDLVEDRLRIPVVAHRPIHRLPDVELLAAASVIAQRELIRVVVLGGQSVRPR